jgi:hypothetical protein
VATSSIDAEVGTPRTTNGFSSPDIFFTFLRENTAITTNILELITAVRY